MKREWQGGFFTARNLLQMIFQREIEAAREEG
jgi:hypothetical protein